jgi:hypothetical protein
MTDSRSSRHKGYAILTGLAALALALGADDPKKTIEAGGLSFKAPESWKTVPVRSPMRKAQLKVDPVEGEDFAAELVVFAFPGGAGSVDANVRRWQSQFAGPDGDPPKIESKTVKGKNVEVTRVETSGRYKPSPLPGAPPEPEREKARLLGAIVVTDRVSYFLKMVGPDKTMAKVRPAFDELLSSIEVEDK